MSNEDKLEKMQKIAMEHANGLMKEKYAIGAFLFGSIASGRVHEESDIDLAVVYNTISTDIKVGKEERKANGFKLEIWRYPIAPFMNTFEDEKLRDKPDTWMWTSLWLDTLQNGVILVDPTRRLADWKAKAKEWNWRQTEIKPALRQAESNLKSARRYLAQGDPFASLICLREAVMCLSAAVIMKYGLIPSFRPKDMNQKLSLIEDAETKLKATYESVNDAADLDHNLVESFFFRLKEFIDSEWGSRQLGPRSELGNARSCLNKKDLVGAMLSLRYSAYWLGYHILNKRGHVLEAQICNGDNHVKMVNQLPKASGAFHEFYNQLHFSQKWDLKKVQNTIDQIQEQLSQP